MLTRLIVAGTVSVAVLAAWAPARGANAQYPPPNGNCVIVTSASAAVQGGSVTVTVTVRDGNGNPQANVPVPVNVTRQPGSGASVAMDSSTTDANGTVRGTLQVGTTGGTVEVTASPAGMSCKATVTLGTTTVAPQVALPATGAAREPDGIGRILWVAVALAAAGTFVAGVGFRGTSRNAGR